MKESLRVQQKPSYRQMCPQQNVRFSEITQRTKLNGMKMELNIKKKNAGTKQVDWVQLKRVDYAECMSVQSYKPQGLQFMCSDHY